MKNLFLLILTLTFLSTNAQEEVDSVAYSYGSQLNTISFSDGYADQFGGDRGKKMKSAVFRRFLVGINEKSMEEQEDLIRKNFEEWKNDYEQVDDVCVIGVRV